MRPWSVILGVLLIASALLVGCSDDPLGYTFEDLPPGDAARGAEAFAGSAACIDCHSLDGSKSTGPSVAGYGDVAQTRVKEQSPEDYTFNSILRPAKHIVQGYSNVMPSDYDKKLTQQTVSDLIAYVLGL